MNEINIRTAPIKSKNHSINLILKLANLSLINNKEMERIIIDSEEITGATTGPIHGIGIKKRMSQVNKETGQFKIIFRPT